MAKPYCEKCGMWCKAKRAVKAAAKWLVTWVCPGCGLAWETYEVFKPDNC